ncbi:creatinine amidohydrolase [Halovenus aranensis]|uniref:Creatinine amidohydrolase n=1 Tax=Halovenus aranensis TaxID=890420 RepID=A0A1G8VB76_9EURY|nr:creatininase family protein [Halovenus aranensis]SDJ63154.1 creatinine amidohydrolase [Halovenus aranensis]
MRLADHTTTTAAEALESVDVAVVPVGSTEQHGPALPLGTDFITADAFAEAVTDRDDVAVLPTIPVGVSEHHRQFHGTLWVSPETFEEYVTETIEAVASHGVRKAVFVNGHGGNVNALERAARRLRGDGTAFAPTWNWWESVPELSDDLFDSDGGHAGPAETSLLLELAASLVREDALEEAGDGVPESWGKSVHGASVGFDTIDFTPTGVVGDPTEGSRVAGEELFQAASEELNALVDWLVDKPFDSLRSTDHV